MSELRTDFENIEDFARVRLYPNTENPIHNEPIIATFISGYFQCDGSNPVDGPDYYFGDVFKYNEGFEYV